MRRRPHAPRIDAAKATIGLAALIVAASVWWSLDDVELLQIPDAAGMLVLFMVAITIGEVARLTILGRRETAPLSTAAALALTMTSLVPSEDQLFVPSSVVVVATAFAMGIGVLVHAVRRQPIGLPEVAARIVGLSVASVLYRRVPFEGRTLLEWQGAWADRRWLIAVVMLLVSLVAVLVSLGLEGAIRSQQEHSPLLRTIVNEYREAVGLTTALVTTGALIALAEVALDYLALPLFLFPLLLTQFAVRRYGAIRETYRQTIGALSCLTERAGYTREEHASRVTELAVAIGRDLGMTPREVTELEYAALLHDLGQVALRDPIPGGSTILAAPADQQRIARDGAEIVRRTGVLDNVAHILEAQTTPYRQVREFGQDLPMPSRIIKVVNAFDDLSGGRYAGPDEERAMERIHLGLGYEYDPRVVDALSRVLERRNARTSPLTPA
ncbi:HD-GYP domain-containing protein [Knoellia sp. p5-6-4]|uniref:HD-GYP domain-containing protein n=1 Tax=unclassified Knoellia TaxID=2618719 RepID=UPI0023DA2DA9|nr:HD domain-containing phosphohydrolase [Knoellia sp. p5-6-4]MDF2144169.1 HD domain-containing protein [Knoellia sp. p5-6-4]